MLGMSNNNTNLEKKPKKTSIYPIRTVAQVDAHKGLPREVAGDVVVGLCLQRLGPLQVLVQGHKLLTHREAGRGPFQCNHRKLVTRISDVSKQIS